MLGNFTRVMIACMVVAGCTETPTNVVPTDDELIHEYFWDAPVGTINVLAATNTNVTTQPPDSSVKKYFWYYKIAQKNVVMPNGRTGTMCTTWFSDSPTLVDTIYYFVEERSIYFRYPQWTLPHERGLVITVPVRLGDSLKLGVSQMFTHQVVELDKNVAVGDRTYKCVVLRATDTTMLGGMDQVSVYSQELYFAPEVMQVRTVVNRTVTTMGVVEKRSTSTIDLVKIIQGK